ncbi:MAG: hypothetical protein PHQ51_03425, partial [Synergistales bacterium]|nr:hypothetical protein [Synergistales bacterium]
FVNIPVNTVAGFFELKGQSFPLINQFAKVFRLFLHVTNPFLKGSQVFVVHCLPLSAYAVDPAFPVACLPGFMFCIPVHR